MSAIFHIKLEQISKFQYNKTIIPAVSGQINQGDKIGLIGRNGVGKTTLARIIGGLEQPDEGAVTCNWANPIIVYLPPQPQFAPGKTVYQELYEAVQTMRMDNEPCDAITRKMLYEAGIALSMWEQEAQTLSGGEKTKLMLCKILTQPFDVLLLDEPTNHLDLQSVVWLENKLQQLKQTVLLISHNRALLNQVTNRTWVLSAKGLRQYRGNYSAYRQQRAVELAEAQTQYEKQQVRIGQLEEAIRKQKRWVEQVQTAHSQLTREKTGRKTANLKKKIEELEQLRSHPLAKPQTEKLPAFGLLNKQAAADKKLASVILRVQQVRKQFGEKTVLEQVSFCMERGDKIALLGRNGAGKSTLLKLISGQQSADAGQIHLDQALRIGCFSQEFEQLQAEHTVLDTVLQEDISVGEARTLLGCLLFQKDDVFKKTANLSMGEKSRVAFARLIARKANLLLLDEPTNYLDIAATEQMERVLQAYSGSILLVTHDCYLAEQVANKLLVLEAGQVMPYQGSCADYAKALSLTTDSAQQQYDAVTLHNRRLELEYRLACLGGKLAELPAGAEKQAMVEAYLQSAAERERLR